MNPLATRDRDKSPALHPPGAQPRHNDAPGEGRPLRSPTIRRLQLKRMPQVTAPFGEGREIAVDERVWPEARPRASEGQGGQRARIVAVIAVLLACVVTTFAILIGQSAGGDLLSSSGSAASLPEEATAPTATIDGGPGEAILSLELPEEAEVHVSLLHETTSGTYTDLGQRRLGIRQPGSRKFDLTQGQVVARGIAGTTTWASPRIPFRVGEAPRGAAGVLAPGSYVAIVQTRAR